MRGDCDESVAKEKLKRSRIEPTQRKVNALLASLLRKEEDLELYKNRLKELEGAFYYNLELISERDNELRSLEKQVAARNQELQEVVRERNELEGVIKAMDEKNGKRIHQLEKRLSQKEEEIQNLRRENLSNIGTLKRIIDDVKAQQEKKLNKISEKFECQKNEMMKSYRDQMEEKEKYYLLEIDNLAGKLEQACREKSRLAFAEKEVRLLKCQLEDVEKLFLEKETQYLEEINKINEPQRKKVNKEVQCVCKGQKMKSVQAMPDVAVAVSQTCPGGEEDFQRKIRFLQEQNEVLKFVIKDLKKSREGSGQPPGCECLTLREDIEVVKREMESEMSNLREILEGDLRGRAEEEVLIGNLESSVRCLKEKLLSGLEDRVHEVTGNDCHNVTCKGDCQVALLEQKLCQKMDSLMAVTLKERQEIHLKLEEFKKKTVERMDKYLESREEPAGKRDLNLLQKIRLEIHKLENKIERDLRSMRNNNWEGHRCKGSAVGSPRNGGGVDGCCRNELAAEVGEEGGDEEIGK